jgi:integrase
MSKPRVPSYRRHKPTDQAVVTLGGRDFYLGKWKSQASRAEYDRLVSEWTKNGRRLPGRSTNDLSIVELSRDYLHYAKGYYVKNGEPTKTYSEVQIATTYLCHWYGHTNAVDFGPLSLKSLRDRLVKQKATRGGVKLRTALKDPKPGMFCGKTLSRRYINKLVEGICRMFIWAVAEERIPPSVAQALDALPGLKKGRSEARETGPVLPVAEDVVEATLGELPAVVADMVRFQRYTGCRPVEVCMVRPCDVDTSGEVWRFKPSVHKTEHHGRERAIFIGPKAQDVLRPYLLRESTAFCFTPADSERRRLADRHAERTTPLSCGNRPGTNRKRKRSLPPGDRYTADSYRRAIARACAVAKVESWAPNRLRHSAATEIRQRFGLEAAQVTLGHSTAIVTQIYAERDSTLAEKVARAVG